MLPYNKIPTYAYTPGPGLGPGPGPQVQAHQVRDTLAAELSPGTIAKPAQTCGVATVCVCVCLCLEQTAVCTSFILCFFFLVFFLFSFGEQAYGDFIPLFIPTTHTIRTHAYNRLDPIPHFLWFVHAVGLLLSPLFWLRTFPPTKDKRKKRACLHLPALAIASGIVSSSSGPGTFVGDATRMPCPMLISTCTFLLAAL